MCSWLVNALAPPPCSVRNWLYSFSRGYCNGQDEGVKAGTQAGLGLGLGVMRRAGAVSGLREHVEACVAVGAHTFSVPRNSMCSRKWASPGSSSGSQKLPESGTRADMRVERG